MLSRRNVLMMSNGAVASLFTIKRAQAVDALQDGSFKQEAVALLARRHPDWTVVSGVDPTMLRIGSESISLTNLYLHVYSMNSVDREREIIAFFENAIRADNTPNGESFATVEAHLRLQIVPDDYKQTASDLLCRQFFAGLSVAYALDDDTRYRLLRQPDVSAWAVAQSKIDAQATANLEALSISLILKPTPGAGSGAFVTINTSDGYDAARLVLPHFMARLRATLNVSQVFVGIPNRDFMVAWTPDFSARRGFAAKIAQDVRARPHPLTDTLFVSSEAGVRPADAKEMADHGQ